MFKLKVSGAAVSFVSVFMAHNDIRYYLKGIHMEPAPADIGGVVLAATDGHALALWHDKDGHVDRPVIAKVTKPLLAACRKAHTCLECDGKRLAAVRYDPAKAEIRDELYVQPIPLDAPSDREAWELGIKFPDFMRVIGNVSEYKPGTPDCINVDLLARMYAAKQAGRNQRGKFSRAFEGAVLKQRSPGGGILVQMPYTPEALIVIMPMRGEEVPESWFKQYATAGTPAAPAAPPPQPSDSAPAVE